MRITQSMYFKNIYGENNTQLGKKLFDVNKQIASGVKIQYAKDDIQTFTDTMRLDNEITILKQIKSSTDSGYKISDQSDVILSEFEEKLADISPLLIKASNGTNSQESLDAIAKELRGIEVNLRNLANSSINGKYLFSGSAVDVRPIADDGTYLGNDKALNSFTGSRVSQQFNVSGAELFLGENSKSNREITTNVAQSSNVGGTLSTATTMADYNGTLPGANQHHFYLRGTKSDGTAFKTDIALNNNNTVQDLLDAIGSAYGNGATNVVDVSMNSSGQIVIADKLKGSSKLDFHMVGASDFNAADVLGGAGITDIDTLDGETTDYATASAGAGDVLVREYLRSSFTPTNFFAANTASSTEGVVYDRTQFTQDGSKLSSNTPQILKRSHLDSNGVETIAVNDRNGFAEPSTKISEVADLSQGTAGTLHGTVLNLEGLDINGAKYVATVNFVNTAGGGSTFSVDTDNDNVTDTTYNIYNIETIRTAVDADEMTYQQLMDVMNMVVTGTLPAAAPGTAAQYDTAIQNSKSSGTTNLTYDGKIEFNDLVSSSTKAKIAMYDSNSDTFNAGSAASVMTFNTNNALTVRDPKSDFFKTLDEIITSVEDYKTLPDASSGSIRNVGMENALAKLEDLQDQIGRAHSFVGAQSNALSDSLERTSLLELSTATLRSTVIDTDLAEASLTLTQLTLNYEAMLSTVGKVSQLSLVNYL